MMFPQCNSWWEWQCDAEAELADCRAPRSQVSLYTKAGRNWFYSSDSRARCVCCSGSDLKKCMAKLTLHLSLIPLKNHYVPSVSLKPLWSVVAKKASTNRRLGGQTVKVKVPGNHRCSCSHISPTPDGIDNGPFWLAHRIYCSAALNRLTSF